MLNRKMDGILHKLAEVDGFMKVKFALLIEIIWLWFWMSSCWLVVSWYKNQQITQTITPKGF